MAYAYRAKLKNWSAISVSILLIQFAGGMQARAGFPFSRKRQEIYTDSHKFVAIAGGGRHSLALRPDGSIMGWGSNEYGQAEPPDGKDFVAIAAGDNHSLALKSDGSIVSWGNRLHGLTDPPVGNDFIGIAAGSEYSLALRSSGRVLGWGRNVYGEVVPPDSNDFVAISAGRGYSLALRSDGSIIGWGYSLFGQTSPPYDNDFIAIAQSFPCGFALKSNGRIVGWGINLSGQLPPPEGNDFAAIAAGDQHCLAQKSNGRIVAWGDNSFDQINVPDGNDFVAIAAGDTHSLALKSDGSIVAWGNKLALKKPEPNQRKSKKEVKHTKKELTEEVRGIVEVNDVSSFKPIESLPKTIKLTLDNKIGVDLIYIKPGSFIMGRDVGRLEKFSSFISPSEYPDEGPRRKVKITKGFYIGKYKVTTTQFCDFLNTIDNPGNYVELNIFARIEMKDGAYIPRSGCEKGAINVVPWEGAVAFCDWLSHQTGLIVRLPTEAEWEFVARGPENQPYPWGKKKDVGWYEGWDYRKYSHPWSCAPVDTFPENATPHGVVGMVGDVGEWCYDFYGIHYLKNDVVDPKGPREEDLSEKSLNPFEENYHVYRGWSSWSTVERSFGDSVDGDGIYGFRIVVEPP